MFFFPTRARKTDSRPRFSSAPWRYCSALLMSATGNALTRSPKPERAVSCVLKVGDENIKNEPSSSVTVIVPSGWTVAGRPATRHLLTGSRQPGTREPAEQAAEPATVAAGARQCDRGRRLTFCVCRCDVRKSEDVLLLDVRALPARHVCGEQFADRSRDFLLERVETDLGLVARLGEVPGFA